MSDDDTSDSSDSANKPIINRGLLKNQQVYADYDYDSDYDVIEDKIKNKYIAIWVEGNNTFISGWELEKEELEEHYRNFKEMHDCVWKINKNIL